MEYVHLENGKSIEITHCLGRWIMNVEEDQDAYVDHIKSKETLNYRRSNLRISSNSDNLGNRKGANKNSKTGIRNVNYIESSNEYWVQIMKNGKRYHWTFPIDQFKEACDFAIEKRKEIFGEFAGNS